MSEISAETDTILIVTDDTPQIAIPDGTKGGTVYRGDWEEEIDADYPTSKGDGSTIPVSTRRLEQKMTRFLQSVGRLSCHFI